jgi:IS5 family transposase
VVEHSGIGGDPVIKLRHAQPTVWEGLFAEEVAELWEPWMRVVDELLEDEELLDTVYDAQGKRYAQSRVRGRQQTPAEVALRMLILKHVRNWSYEILEREVRANVVYRSFCRVGMEKVPDAKTLVRLGQVIGAKSIAELHDRIVALAQERGVIQGRKMRVDTTVVETNIHYPTDSGLLNDGARVLTRTMKKMAGKAGGLKRKVRDRTRSVRKRVMAIAQAVRHKGGDGERKRQRVSATAAVDATDSQRFPQGAAGSRGAAGAPEAGRTGVRGTAGNDGGSSAQSSAADQGSGFRGDYAISGQTAEPVCSAHGNHTQGEGCEAQRVWQCGRAPRSREPDHYSL